MMKGFISKLKQTPAKSFLRTFVEKINFTADYLIIGGGSAGCVLASRLSENPNVNVLLLEAGHTDRRKIDSWKIHMPSALTYNIASEKYNWNYSTEPQENLNNRRLVWPRGKVLGGSSSLNAMCYVRGNALDYERWAEEAPGWEYRNVLPYFKKAQTHELGGNEYRGSDGPLHVTRTDMKNKLFEAYINSGLELGYPFTEDMNGYQQEGFGPMDRTIYNGQRWSTSSAYLQKALTRSNLKVISNSFVNRVIFDSSNTAIGVEVEKEDGTNEILYYQKEIILSAGAINSPQLLMLSGIGNETDLDKLGIKTIVDNSNVGQNLQDHIELYLQHECNEPITLSTYANWLPNPAIKFLAGAEWFLKGTGICAGNHFDVGAFFRSKKGIKFPDIQHHFFPGAVEQQKDVIKAHAYQIHCGTMRPKSRGYIKLKSNNPREKPTIEPNIFSEKEDLEDLKDSVRLTIEVLHSKSLSQFSNRAINYDVQMALDDKLLEAWVKDRAESAYHCSCTCAMGKVTESDGKVKGVNNLRVCDASIMPFVPSGNTNAPTIMLAERISDIIKGEVLPSSPTKFYVADNWENRQR